MRALSIIACIGGATLPGYTLAAPRQPVLVANDFPAPAASRDLEARVHTAIRAPSFLVGDTGDAVITRKGSHGLNSYIRNLRAYARDDGQLEIRFNIVADEGDTFVWPSQIPARLFVRLFDQNGMYLTRFMTRESFAPAESIVRELTTGAIGLVNPSPVLLLDSDGKSNVIVYTVNARDLDYARIVEVGFYLRPVDASEMRGVPEDEQWLPPGAQRPEVSCTDYMRCLAPKTGLRSPNPSGTSASPKSAPQPTAATSPKRCSAKQPVELKSQEDFLLLVQSLWDADKWEGGLPIPDPRQVARFEAAKPSCSLRPGDPVLLHGESVPLRFFIIEHATESACKGVTLNDVGFDCPA